MCMLTKEDLHGGDRLGGLGIHNILGMPFYFEPRVIKEYPITNMMQNELIYISFQSGVVNIQVIGWEDHGTARTNKESIYIRINNPTLNRNVSKFNLHHIWDRIPLNTPGFKIKRHAHLLHSQSTQPINPMDIFIGSMEHAQRTLV